MKLNIEEIKIGDYVKVKNGIKAPDFEYQSMDNWQGKIVEIQKNENLVDIEWDTETLLNTPEKYLKDLIKEGYDYGIMTLEISELERVNRRDNSSQRNDIKSRRCDSFFNSVRNVFESLWMTRFLREHLRELVSIKNL